ncbi:CusA/CzcA family heavy metal efflux RND transporter [bacterium SCSIO 12643]|nr:CusA/CzcA family heavy metal efflux RND transporter [bacterium SCSIO 12643]
MINNIIAYSIRNKLIIGVFTLAIIVMGIWSMSKVPIDAVPDITNNQVQIITQAPNLGTVDIEQFVTYPVEVSMSNLPGVAEIRSISRFGLSLVTVVFEDDMGTYLPRQLVAEKLTEVASEIPEGFGTPEIGPISTGLGEIYQYSLEVDEEYRDQYSLSDLRTVQDWIIRRQMAMVPGVVEVNAFGGNIKQYEVAVSPEKLKSLGVTMSEVFEALAANNQNSGGAYIEKNHQANFIRGEGLARSLDDIRKIVLRTENNIPLTINDVATVQYGKAIRYGALTKDGEGEAVGGMILMLKGANSNDVIEAVKNRVEKIQKSLPEGVRIEPFLDRSRLISNTIGTVSTNLIEGALIVIFILVFLLGNWRGGLIVASTIPLSLLFAFILMNVFDVWANLMSLGAIDFGIIIDGAVIIVEGTVFLLHEKVVKNHQMDTKSRDAVAIESSSKMMNSAFFGQLIILIVFIPILALQGVEGKMFKPMALTFMFAMMGVMILCLTYVPMMSAWFLKVSPKSQPSPGDRLVKYLENAYEKVLQKTMYYSKAMIISALTLLALAVFSFMQLGGEFIPKLDEGDIAFHVILKPGSSLSETIETTTKVEQIVKQNFPEVEHVISRIGVADVPTDPMPMDIADCFAILQPKSEWRPGMTKEKLIAELKSEIDQIPGVNYEFTQPIEMRFNELLTGVREDVAVKLFGEDLDVLAVKAEEMGRLISTVDGVADMKVEATSGLPQITIKYNRYKLAQYGLNVSDLNEIIQTAFAGSKAGVIFEGERRFDMVVRLNQSFRDGIDHVKNLYVYLESGAQIPLKEVAEISYVSGPMQISRDNTNRRTYVGVNVRGRDVKSVVTDIQNKLESQLELPPGYYIRYGGAFENFERATGRLKVVVPAALGLIFILIFFALQSVKQTLMIYMAIPLAAIGGIFSLWLRDMPFSISAGVGFIVLFGVAVLNGLVLISGWNELKHDQSLSLSERIRIGAKRRIRPILLTALTDIFGFLPMAISTSAGAEIQRPLATVVIGGMITATFLTLFVLPILYKWMENKTQFKVTIRKSVGVFLICSVFSSVSMAQSSPDSLVLSDLSDVISVGLASNGNVSVARQGVAMEELGKKSAWNLGKTNVLFRYGQYNSYRNDFAVELNQSLSFPTVYGKQNKLAKERIAGSQAQLDISKNELQQKIKQSWYQLSYLLEQKKLLEYQDSIFQRFAYAAHVRYETEASTYLEKVTAETKAMEVKNNLNLIHSDIIIEEEQLRALIHDTVGWKFEPKIFEERDFSALTDSQQIQQNPMLKYVVQQIEIAQAEKEVELAKSLPDLQIGYFNQSLDGSRLSNGDLAVSSDRFSGIQAGISIPIFFGSYKADVRAKNVQREMVQTQADYYSHVLQNEYDKQLQQVLKYDYSLKYYKHTALQQADLLIENAQKSYENGGIGYIEYFQSLTQGLQMKFGYLETLNAYNQSIINLEYLLGVQ